MISRVCSTHLESESKISTFQSPKVTLEKVGQVFLWKQLGKGRLFPKTIGFSPPGLPVEADGGGLLLPKSAYRLFELPGALLCVAMGGLDGLRLGVGRSSSSCSRESSWEPMAKSNRRRRRKAKRTKTRTSTVHKGSCSAASCFFVEDLFSSLVLRLLQHFIVNNKLLCQSCTFSAFLARDGVFRLSIVSSALAILGAHGRCWWLVSCSQQTWFRDVQG